MGQNKPSSADDWTPYPQHSDRQQDPWIVIPSPPPGFKSASRGESGSSLADGGTAKAGCLLVLNSQGSVRETISNRWINGPWDMTAADHGSNADLFVTNVLNGTVAGSGAVVNRGTVVRIRVHLPAAGLPVAGQPVVIASGFAERTDPDALVIGPTGVALASGDNTLYVADTASNRIAAIPDATTRTTTAFTGLDVTANGALNSPLGLVAAPNGDLLSVNGGDGLIVETTRAGRQRATHTLDASGSPAGAGTLFGLAVTPNDRGVYFVDDGANSLNLLR
jgi:DNA-binding beta-propeller fold protein YncE